MNEYQHHNSNSNGSMPESWAQHRAREHQQDQGQAADGLSPDTLWTQPPIEEPRSADEIKTQRFIVGLFLIGLVLFFLYCLPDRIETVRHNAEVKQQEEQSKQKAMDTYTKAIEDWRAGK